MARIDCPVHCGRAVGTSEPNPLTQIASGIAAIATVVGITGNLLSTLDKPGVTVGIIVLMFLTLGFILVALLWTSAVDQCTQEPIVMTDKGPQKIRGTRYCIAGVVWKTQSDFTGFTTAWLAPWTASHDRIDVIVSSRFWEIVEISNADVFCTDDKAGRVSEYMRCYFYTDRVCKAATASAVAATVVFLLLFPIVFFIVAPFIALAIPTCALVVPVVAASAGVQYAILGAIIAGGGCAAATAIVVVVLLIFAALILAAATIAGWIAAATSSITPESSVPWEPNRTSSKLFPQISVGDLISVEGKVKMREESDELFYNLNVNIFWWVESAKLLGKVPDNIPNNPFSYVEINDLLYVSEPDGAGGMKLVNHDGCGDEFTNVLPNRCRK